MWQVTWMVCGTKPQKFPIAYTVVGDARREPVPVGYKSRAVGERVLSERPSSLPNALLALETAHHLSPTISFPLPANSSADIFCRDRRFMLRPPVNIPELQRFLHPNISSSLVRFHTSLAEANQLMMMIWSCSVKIRPAWPQGSLTFVVTSMTSFTATGMPAFLLSRSLNLSLVSNYSDLVILLPINPMTSP